MSVLVHVGTGFSFYFSEIIIRSDVNLLTSNQLSDIGEVGEVQPALIRRVQRLEHGWQTEYLNAEYFNFLHSTISQLFSQIQGHAIIDSLTVHNFY